ncbi:MAG TPA: hypothetical protein VMX94_06100 [Armatimonadota bacterium]|nr:hypothetical protein [Armatimonadota bacterium]
MSEIITVVGSCAAVGVPLAGALAYGFKKMVDVLGDELKYNRKDISLKLDQHMQDCKVCQGGRGFGGE